MSDPHKVSRPRPYMFLVVENDPPYWTRARMETEENYERVWNKFVDRWGQEDVQLKVYEMVPGGNRGFRFVMDITSPYDLEKL